MSTNSSRDNYLLLATLFVVFYPTKGLLNLLYYLPQFESSPVIFNKFIFALLIISLLILLLHSKFKVNKYFFHIIITMIAMGLSINGGDMLLINKVLMLFILPILLSVFDNVSEIYVERIIRSFFKFTLIYMAIEFIILNIRIDGINLISLENYETFYSIISPDGKTIDFRHGDSWWIFRSGGYLADALAMPVLVLMSTIYFYINYRLYKRYLFYALLGIFLVISNVSTTAIISLIVTILIFEFYRFNLKNFLIIASMIIIIILVHPTVDYIIIRVKENFNNPEYLQYYFNYDFIFVLKNYYYFIFGRWSWFSNNISSHLDIFLIPASMGLIGFYILYKIFLRGFFVYRKKNIIFTIYSYILFSTFITLYHHAMTLSINVLILVLLISSRVNNSIKPKIKYDYYLFNLLNWIVASKAYKKFKGQEIERK